MTHDLRIRRVRHSAAALAVVAAAAVALSGCVGLGSPGGTAPDVDERTSSDVVAELQQVPGVLDAVVTSGPNGLPSQVELHAGLNLEAGYPGDLPTLLDYTLAMAWSVTAKEPTTVVSVGFLDGETAVDLGPVAAELGWTGAPGPGLDLSVDDLAERYGPWPGPVPERPDALG
jgi:hypothetical protein